MSHLKADHRNKKTNRQTYRKTGTIIRGYKLSISNKNRSNYKKTTKYRQESNKSEERMEN